MGKKNKPKKPSEPPKPPQAADGAGEVRRAEVAHSVPAVPEEGQATASPPSRSDSPQDGMTVPPPSRENDETRLGADAVALPPTPLPRSRLRRLLPDIIKVTLAVLVIGLAVAVWLKPPLLRDTLPYVTYTFKGQAFSDAVLYRPLSVPARFYVGLPEKLEGRYQWFTVDKLREIAALADGPPQGTFLGWPAVRRNAPLGLDLEFRTIDGAEWQVFFFKDAIVFSNNVLSVRLDTKKPTEATGDSR